MRWNQPDIPFAPRRCPIFYGWVILVVTTIGTLASLPGQTIGVGVFNDALIEALGIDRAWISRAYMFGTIASALVLPWAGRFLDRVGARVMTVLSSLGLGLAMVLLVAAPHIADYLPLSPLLAGTLTASVVFFLIRFTGQGCLTLAARVAISKWFERRRGLVVGIMGVFLAFGFNTSPVLLNVMLERFGWENAALLLAASVGIGMTILGWVTYRDNPEECGLLPDGATQPEELAHEVAAPDEKHEPASGEPRHGAVREFTRRQAMLTLPFWAFAMGLGTQAFIFTAFTFHVADLGDRHALSREAAYAIFWWLPFFGVPLNFFASWASDRYPMKWQLIAMLLLQAMGTIGLLTYGDVSGRWLMIVGYGSSMGIFGSLLTTPWPKFYGRLHLGGIGGLVTSVMVISSAVGPSVFAEAERLFGDYTLAIVASIVPAIVVALLALDADSPQNRMKRAASETPTP